MYRTELEKKYGATTRKITFRSKEHSWRQYSVLFSFNNNTNYNTNMNQNIFMRGFLQDLYLRPSCYNCKSKTLNRLSDLTIADFWGVENIVPEIDDDKGTSLVLVNSDKGKKVFQKLQDKMIMKHVDCGQAIKYNSSAIKSVNMNTKREKFFKELDCQSCEISELINKYTKISFAKKVYKKIIGSLSIIKKMILKL